MLITMLIIIIIVIIINLMLALRMWRLTSHHVPNFPGAQEMRLAETLHTGCRGAPEPGGTRASVYSIVS